MLRLLMLGRTVVKGAWGRVGLATADRGHLIFVRVGSNTRFKIPVSSRSRASVLADSC